MSLDVIINWCNIWYIVSVTRMRMCAVFCDKSHPDCAVCTPNAISTHRTATCIHCHQCSFYRTGLATLSAATTARLKLTTTVKGKGLNPQHNIGALITLHRLSACPRKLF